MKKLKFLGTAVLAASLLFAGCSSPVEEVNPDDTTPPEVETPETPVNPENPGNPENPEGGKEENKDAFTVTFTDETNKSEFVNGVYTVTLATAHAAGDEWGNQIFIKNPNAKAGAQKGDIVKATVTATADKDISTFFFKNQYNGGNYTGHDTSKALAANTETVFQVIGKVTDDYDDSSSFVIAIRGNEADTTLTLKDVKSEVITGYQIESITLLPATSTIKTGESITFKVVDQYGIEIPEAVIEVVTEGVSSTLSGMVLTGADADETIEVKATYNDFTATSTITVEKIAAATKSWGLDLTENNTSIGVLPVVNVASWGGADTAPAVEEFANRKAVKFTIPAAYAWIGAAWQGNPDTDKIDVSGYSTLTITYNDSAFAEDSGLTDYNVKVAGGKEVPLKGTVSDADADGWKTITVNLSDYANAGVTLSSVTCINFCDWKAGSANPGAGALYIAEVSFNPAE